MNVPDKLRAIADEVEALLRGQANPAVPEVPRPQDAAARYLAANPDVAAHIYFGRHPLEHWQIHGQKEGRTWPEIAPPVAVTHPAWTEPTVAAQTYAGQFDADSVSDTEAAYVYAFTHTQAGSALANKVYWQGGLFSGSVDAINRLVNRGEQKGNEMHLNAYDAVAKWPDSPVKRAVMAVL